jgi:hypothetical protein
MFPRGDEGGGRPCLWPSLTIPKKILSLSGASVPAGSSALPMMMPAVLAAAAVSRGERSLVQVTGGWQREASNQATRRARPAGRCGLSLSRPCECAGPGGQRQMPCAPRSGQAGPGGGPGRTRRARGRGHGTPAARPRARTGRTRPAGRRLRPVARRRATVALCLPASVAVLLPASIVAEVTRRPPGQEGEGRFRRRRSDVALFVFGGGRHPRVAGTRRETYWYCTVL